MGRSILILIVALVAGSIVASLFVSSFVRGTTEEAEVAYKRALDACERANPLRVVVYRNTVNAIQANRNRPVIAEVFRNNKRILLLTTGIDPHTGKVNCDAVVTAP